MAISIKFRPGCRAAVTDAPARDRGAGEPLVICLHGLVRPGGKTIRNRGSTRQRTAKALAGQVDAENREATRVTERAISAARHARG